MFSSFQAHEMMKYQAITNTLFNVLTFIFIAVITFIYTSVIFPVMSKLFKQDGNLLQLSFVKSIKYLSMIMIPISVACFFYGGDAITLCYGNQYSQAGDVLKILIWTICFLFINGACSMILNASHKETAVTKIYSFAALFNVCLNLILIPLFSVYGASIPTVISEILILVLELYTIHKISQLPDKYFLVDILKVIVCSAILSVILYLLNLSLWLAIPVSFVVYLIAIIITKTFDKQDIMIFKQIIGR